jgi:kumamolisin
MAAILEPTYTLECSRIGDRPALTGQKGKKVHFNTVVTFSVFVPCERNHLDDHLNAMTSRIANGNFSAGKLAALHGQPGMNQMFKMLYGAKPGNIARAVTRLQRANIKVQDIRQYNGEIICRGRLCDVRRLISNIELHEVTIGGRKYRMRSGAHEIAAPKGMFTALTGLDTLPLAVPHHRILNAGEPSGIASPRADRIDSAFQPLEFRPIYNLTAGTGKGQKIGIVALAGGSTPQDDIDYLHDVMGLKDKNPNIKVVLIDGATGKKDPDGADVETRLDKACALGAYDAEIIVVISQNTDAGFAHAIAKLIDLGCTVITISWGSGEPNWTKQGLDIMHVEFARAAMTSVSVMVAAGDNLSTDGIDDGMLHVDAPAADILVIPAIGLNLSKDGSKVRIWNNGDSGTGGGVSDVFDLQDWEKIGRQVASLNDGAFRHKLRGLAGAGDPQTGMKLAFRRNGRRMLQIVGGTSATAPIHAGLIACANEVLGHNLGFFLPFANQNAATVMRAVTEGDNAPPGGKGYPAEDLTLGLVNFEALIAEIKKAA